MGSSSSCGGALKTFFGTILFVCFIGFLLVVMNVSSAIEITTTKSSTENLKHLKQLEVKGRDTPVVHSNLDPNYMSKRRVPNGPDPIHNRRAGKSKQPPGRA